MEKAKWIWENNKNNKDEYIKFYEEFNYQKGQTIINFSCDSNYTLYVNGNLAGFGQYADYPHYKVYQTIDITKYLIVGQNKLMFLVWYYGDDSQTYFVGNAGLIYEIINQGNILTYSCKDTLCKKAKEYISEQKIITSQLGFSFKFDTNYYDRFDQSDYIPKDYKNALEVDGITYKLNCRKIKQLELLPLTKATLIDSERQIYDLGKESVGFLQICFKAEKGKVLKIVYGEHLNDIDVRYIIGNRDFSVEIVACGEKFEYINTFRRLGARYLQVLTKDVEVFYIGIKETMYPVNEVAYKAVTALRQKIYDTSVRTLKLCMHEHYEDCPWREQALYAMDSRNQMLCGYYAFKEYEFPRANLELMSKGQKKDKLLPLCFPAGLDAPIPFFSLIYIVQMNEYSKYSKDSSLLKTNIKLLTDMIEVFISRIENNNLLSNMEGYWNFYEWTEGQSDDEFFNKDNKYKKTYDLPLNCFLILALENYSEICKEILIEDKFEKYLDILRNSVRRNFYDSENKLFFTYLNKEKHYSKLSNSLALLTGCCSKEEGKVICDKLTNKKSSMVDITLSMKVFLYDALLKVDKNYKNFILEDIDNVYKYMLDNNATTFWETILGAEDFGGAGSLCHGWSAIPIYYFNILDK